MAVPTIKPEAAYAEAQKRIEECRRRGKYGTSLNLVRLGLSTLPTEIGTLKALERLHCWDNDLTTLPREIGDLTSLEFLNVLGNPLVELPTEVVALKNLIAVHITSRHLIAGQRAAYEQGGWDALKRFLEQMHADKEAGQPTTFLCGKLLLVGEASNGKTCLQEALRGLNPKSGNPTTHGMKRELLTVTKDGNLVPEDKRKSATRREAEWIDFHVWDMGGQEFYKHSHQMFFTPGAIYLAVFRPRDGDAVNRLKAWRELIRARTGNRAQVLVVATHADTLDAKLDTTVSKSALSAEFPGIIRDVVQVDSISGKGITDLRQRLASLATGSKEFEQSWPRAWTVLMDSLAIRGSPYLHWKEWQELCAAQGADSKDEAEQIARAGHLTGTLLWRDELPQGADLVVLNPDWLSRAVARILQDPIARANHGLVTLTHLKRIWTKDGELNDPAYSERTHDLLIALIEANELGYRPKPLAEGQATAPTELLLTQMVDAARPEQVDELWTKAGQGEAVEETRVFAFRKQDRNENGQVPYLIFLLIFRLRRLAIGGAREPSLHWQHGLLVRDETDGLGRIELDGDELRVQVRAVNPASLLATINYAIGEDRDRMWEGLVKTTYLLCGEHCPRKTGDSGRFEEKGCYEAVREGVPKMRCPIATCGKFIEVGNLLHAPRLAPRLENTKSKVEEMLAQILDDASHTREEVVTGFAHMEKWFNDVQGELNELRSVFRTEMDELLRALSDEGRNGPRLFSVKNLEPGFWNNPRWVEARMQVTLWCEHSLQPLPYLERNGGFQEMTVPRKWLVRSVPWLKRTVRMVVLAKLLGPLAIGAAAKAVSEHATDPKDSLEMIRALEEIAKQDSDQLDDVSSEGVSLLPDSLRPEDLHIFGTPLDKDTRSALALRELYKEKDPRWGGMEKRYTSERGWLWMHRSFLGHYDH